ncbi:MAG: hypothetical protein LUG16_02205 [Candidatus Gastranaerophilales bacterium]|nr:hypothetical protein [Candidatus Gastranaerophilales bacterium]
MQIQAASTNSMPSCQPIKPGFGSQKSRLFDVLKEQCFGSGLKTEQADEVDTFICGGGNSSNVEEKYNLACQIAGYYKAQCDSLKQNGVCEA